MTKRERQAELAKRFHHIGDVAALTGLSVDALRAWERVGLLTPQRSAGGVRQYTEDDIARVRLIARTLQRGGFSRAAVALLLQSGDLRPDAADYAPGPAQARSRPSVDHGTGTGSARELPSEGQILAAIGRISDALASDRAIAEVMEVVCAETCWAFGVSDAAIWLAEPFPASPPEDPASEAAPARALAMVALAGQHQSTRLVDGVAASPLSPLSLDDQRFPPVRAFLTRRSIVVTTQDVSTLMHPELAGMVLGAALLCMPLLAADGTALGVIVLQEAHEASRFTADVLERIRTFAVHAALAVQTARLHGALHAAQRAAVDLRVRWQAAVDDFPALVCMCDTDLRITYSSPRCQQVLGWPIVSSLAADQAADQAADRATVQATVQVDQEVRLIHQVDQSALPLSWVAAHGFYWLGTSAPDTATLPSAELPFPRALRTRQAVHGITLAHRVADDTERLITWDAAPMARASGQLLGAIAFGRDVTTEYRLRARAESLVAVTRAAYGAVGSERIEGSASRILAALVDHTPTPPVAADLYMWDEQAGELARVGVASGEGRRIHAPAVPLAPQHPWWQQVTTGPLYSSHDRERPRWLRGLTQVAWEASNIRGWATVPLRSGGTLVGVLVVGLGAPQVWDAAERAWLDACAAAMTMATESGRLVDAPGQMPRA